MSDIGVGGPGDHVDGLIGYEVLARLVTRFDFLRRTITFSRRQSRTAGLPIRFFGNLPLIPGTVNGVAGEFLLATGTPWVRLSKPFLDAHPAIATLRNQPFLTFTVGGRKLESVKTVFTKQSGGLFGSPYLSGSIGTQFWRRCSFTLDYAIQVATLAICSS